MALSPVDWSILVLFILISLTIGIWVSRRNKTSTDYFKAGNDMPWWVLGVSMVATTFSADTPNLVTDIVRQNGIAGNWTWWAFLLSGLLTVFVFARLWRRSEVLTDLEFYEIRYSGKIAVFLRGFRAVYLGLILNVLIMASVSLAAIKLGTVLLGLTPLHTVLITGIITVIYSMLGGLRGVLITDVFQFFLSVTGALVAAIVAVNHPSVGSLSGLVNHPNVADKLQFLPDAGQPELWISIFILPLLVQWWATWYPGSEPGGGGYIAQRMLSARNESDALKSVLLFNIVHYAIRPWPWIIVALASLVVFPTVQDIGVAFPNASGIVSHDMGYPAMLSFIPHGWLGLVTTSLVAAFMSTISTHLNWGSSYLTHDFYARFLDKSASEKAKLNFGRVMIVVSMALAMVIALLLESALDAFKLLVQIGAGTGLLYILRWFWWRINAAAELVALVVSLIIAIGFRFICQDVPDWLQLVSGVFITTMAWIVTAIFTQPTDAGVLASFVRKVNPPGKGWRQFSSVKHVSAHHGPLTYVKWISFGTLFIYGVLLGTGMLLMGQWWAGGTFTLIGISAAGLLYKERDSILTSL